MQWTASAFLRYKKVKKLNRTNLKVKFSTQISPKTNFKAQMNEKSQQILTNKYNDPNTQIPTNKSDELSSRP